MTAIDHNRVARAYELISEGFAELGLAHQAMATEPAPAVSGRGSSPAAAAPAPADSAPSLDVLPAEEQDFLAAIADLPSDVIVTQDRAADPQGSAAVCPSHRLPYRSGRNNTKYCPAKSDEDGWHNDKGYCSITPRSAAAWLRKRAAA
jgi:hypothetical protein